MSEEIFENNNRLSEEEVFAQVHKEFMEMMTNDKASLPHIGIHLMMIREAMGLSLKKASTLLGITPRLLEHYEMGIKEAKGEDRKRIVNFINRLAPEVGYRGRKD